MICIQPDEAGRHLLHLGGQAPAHAERNDQIEAEVAHRWHDIDLERPRKMDVEEV